MPTAIDPRKLMQYQDALTPEAMAESDFYLGAAPTQQPQQYSPPSQQTQMVSPMDTLTQEFARRGIEAREKIKGMQSLASGNMAFNNTQKSDLQQAQGITPMKMEEPKQDVNKLDTSSLQNNLISKYTQGVLGTARQFLTFNNGKPLPYVWGGHDPVKDGGLDCSGFVSYVYKQNGVNFAPQTSSMYNYFKKQGQFKNYSDVKPGDILLFKWGNGPRSQHTAIYYGNGKMIHSSSGGVKISNVSSYYMNGLWATVDMSKYNK